MLLAGGVEPMRGDQLVPGEKRTRPVLWSHDFFLPSISGLRYEMIESTGLEWNWN